MNTRFLMKPKIDFAFKELMMNDMTRKGFLAAVLKINPMDIKKTEILNTFLRKVHKDDKLGILDVRILMNDNTEINIEIQLVELKIWPDRSLFYGAKMFSDQAEEGNNYNNFKKCICINILDFILFPDYDGFYSCFHLAEDTRHSIYTDKLEFHIIELPKLPKELKDNDDLLLWSKFFASEKEEEFEMLASKNKYILDAYEHLQIISQDKKKRLEYEARQKAILDHNQLMFEAEQRGEERAKQKIFEAEQAKLQAEQAKLQAEQAKLQAEQRAKQAELEAKQAKSKNMDIIKNLLDKGYDINFISEITTINVSEIESLCKELNWI